MAPACYLIDLTAPDWDQVLRIEDIGTEPTDEGTGRYLFVGEVGMVLGFDIRDTPAPIDFLPLPRIERFYDRDLWRDNQRAHGAYRCGAAAGRRIRRDVRPSKADARRLARKRWLQSLKGPA